MRETLLPDVMLGRPTIYPPRRGGIDGALDTRCYVMFAGILNGPEQPLYLN